MHTSRCVSKNLPPYSDGNAVSLCRKKRELMIDIGMFEYKVDSQVDLQTIGLGPCVGIVVGYKGRVSMLHAPMPNFSEESFFIHLEVAIPKADRKNVCPILAGCHTLKSKPDREISITRQWVEQKLTSMGFGMPVVLWGEGTGQAAHSLTTVISSGEVELETDDGSNKISKRMYKLW